MGERTGLKIAKRDGSLEPFQYQKLRRCLARAMAACDQQERLADDLGRAVTLHLKEWPKDRPPTSDYVFRCVRTVLDETGLSEVARYLERRRRQRATMRRGVRVLDERRNRAPAAWQKGRIGSTLERKHHLSRSVARILAGEIESRVLTLGYGVVSTGLLAELIWNELLAWGLTDEATRVTSGSHEAEIKPAGKEQDEP